MSNENVISFASKFRQPIVDEVYEEVATIILERDSKGHLTVLMTNAEDLSDMDLYIALVSMTTKFAIDHNLVDSSDLVLGDLDD